MNFRKRIQPESITLQLAPMIDVILFLLTFFLLTWNLARYESDLEVKVPKAQNAKDPQRLPGEVIINIRKEGVITLNRREVPLPELQQILKEVSKNYPDQAVIIRADEGTEYRFLIGVLDVCSGENLWNVAFATNKGETKP
jgi:biopolymer transport protein ExbD